LSYLKEKSIFIVKFDGEVISSFLRNNKNNLSVQVSSILDKWIEVNLDGTIPNNCVYIKWYEKNK
jgi:hypothetical protein